MHSIKELLKTEKSIIIPVAHDAMTAKIIQSVGFKALATGGFAISGVRMGMPDFGIISYREMRDATLETVQASELPALVDADNGYGDILNVERTIQEYQAEPRISAIFLEDQVSPKRCGHLAGKQIVSSEEMEKKIAAAQNVKTRKDLMIMARTDARSVIGLDEALRRAEKYIKAGADSIFIESPESEEELEIIGKNFKGTNLLVNMLNGGKTPMVPRKKLEDWGFNMIAYPSLTLLLVCKALKEGLESLYEHGDTLNMEAGKIAPMKYYHDIIGVTEALERDSLNK